ncbi:PepSY domain-containing protein [Nocardiopsis sp. ARC36]
MHFYAAVLVAPFIVVAALTGLLYVYTPQLEQAVHADLLTNRRTPPSRSHSRSRRPSPHTRRRSRAPCAPPSDRA